MKTIHRSMKTDRMLQSPPRRVPHQAGGGRDAYEAIGAAADDVFAVLKNPCIVSAT